MKRLLAVMLAVLSICTVTAAAQPYMDEYEVMMPEEMKLLKKDKNITREEFCAVIYKLLEMRDMAPEKIKAGFTDTEDERVGALYSVAIAQGYDEKTFGAADFLTREQAATVICRTMDYMGIEDNEQMTGSFRDSALISPWAAEAVERVGRNGIMKGYGEAAVNRYSSYKEENHNRFTLEKSDFGPQDNYTCEQSAITAYRIYTCRPVRTDNEYVREIEDGMYLYMSAYTTWAEINGEITMCTQTAKSSVKEEYGKLFFNAPATGKLNNAQYGAALGENLYNIETGRKIMEFYHDIAYFNEKFIAVETQITPYGLTSDRRRDYYNYSGEHKASVSSSGNKTPSLEFHIDSNGLCHYMYSRNDKAATRVFTDGESLDAAFTYSMYSKIETNENVGNVVKVWTNEPGSEDYECILYSVGGEEIYRGSEEAYPVSDGIYAVKNASGEGMKAYSTSNGAYLWDMNGNNVTETDGKTYVISSDGEKLNYYTLNGKVRLEDYEVINEHELNGKTYVMAGKGTDSEIYCKEDGALYLKLDGMVVEVNENYIHAVVEKENVYYSHKGNVIVKGKTALTDNGEYYSIDNCVLDKNFKTVKEFDERVKWVKNDFVLLSDDRLGSMKSDKTIYAPYVYVEPVYVVDDWVFVLSEDVIKKYDSKLNSCEVNVDVQVKAADTAGKYLLLRDAEERWHFYDVYEDRLVKSFEKGYQTGIRKIGDKEYIYVYKREDFGGNYEVAKTEFYSADNAEESFTLNGKYHHCYLDKYIVMNVETLVAQTEKERGLFYYDMNGNFIGSEKMNLNLE